MTSQQQQLHDEILEKVREYYRLVHAPAQNAPFEPGVTYLNYGGRIFDEHEMVNLVDSALEFWLTAGHYTREFERKLAEYLGVDSALLVNSGSSANLLAFMTLTSPELGERQIARGDEVITVAAGFPTTVSPLFQYGAVPVFVDVEPETANIDVSRLEAARSERTRAVMLAHTLGNPFQLHAVRAFCDKYRLWLIEDNCDALGSRFSGRLTGTWGDIGTSSFYPPHHMTTGEGGALYMNDPRLYRIARSLRDWGRDCRCNSGEDGVCGRRFTGKFGKLPAGYDHKYVYSRFGYNLKVSDMQAAVGCAQLEKLPEFSALRREHFAFLKKELACLEDSFLLPKASEHADPSWFGFPLTCREGISRSHVVACLEKNNIQTRMLFAGNLTRHPCFDEMRRTKEGFRVAGGLENTDRIMNDTFWIGVYPGMTEEMLAFMAKVLKEAVGK